MADLGIQLGRACLQLFLEVPTQRIPANRFVASVPDDQTDLLLRDTETDHDLDVYSLLIGRLKCRPVRGRGQSRCRPFYAAESSGRVGAPSQFSDSTTPCIKAAWTRPPRSQSVPATHSAKFKRSPCTRTGSAGAVTR